MTKHSRLFFWLAAIGLLVAPACNGPTETDSATTDQSSASASGQGAAPSIIGGEGIGGETMLSEVSADEPLQPSSRANDNAPVNLVDVSAESGIGFVHTYDGRGQRYIVEAVAAGMASIDFDLDGLKDLYFLNGSTLGEIDSDVAVQSPAPTNALYRNLGDLHFTRVAANCGLEDQSFSMGVAVADFDNDGFEDVFVNNFGPNKLFRNNGDGTFGDITDLTLLAAGELCGAGACFLDIEDDGDLDLYVGNYVQSPVESNVQRTTDGFPSYAGPLDFQPESDLLFRNDGQGGFEDITESSGAAKMATTTMGVIASDGDGDGDTDIFVVNDVQQNLYLENDGTGKFEDAGIPRGLAFSADARRNGNMGVECADYDNDGALDFFTTTFSNDVPVLYRNLGDGYFEDITLVSGAGSGLRPHANWGTAMCDVDLDGDRDILIANGDTDPNVEKWAFNTAWKVANTLLLNDGEGRFIDATRLAGSGLAPVESSRALVAEDLDNDGDLDFVFLNALAGPTLVRNDTQSTFRWLHIELVGRTSPRDGTGTKVRFELSDRVFIDEVHSGRGYQSSYGKRLHFGLGDQQTIEQISVLWPDGTTQIAERVATNQSLRIVQP